MNKKDFAIGTFSESAGVSKKRKSALGSRQKLWAITISCGVLGLLCVVWLQRVKNNTVKPNTQIAMQQEAKNTPKYEFYKTLEKGEVRMLEAEDHEPVQVAEANSEPEALPEALPVHVAEVAQVAKVESPLSPKGDISPLKKGSSAIKIAKAEHQHFAFF